MLKNIKKHLFYNIKFLQRFFLKLDLVKFPEILKILGAILMMFSIAFLLPIFVSIYYQETIATTIFIKVLFIILLSGAALNFTFHRYKRSLKVRDGFVITVLVWLVLCLAGSLPFIMYNNVAYALPISYIWVDAIFESVSGLTTTGATIIPFIDTKPISILIYRQLLQFLGGLGIVILAVAVLPSLGVGSMNLYSSESTGPFKNEKLTPKIADTAKLLFCVYLILNVACTLSYYLAGMPPLEALGHSFSTISLGGMAMHGDSIGYYNNTAIDIVAMIFMLLSAMNFCWHIFAFQRRSASHYWQSAELRFFFIILTIAIALSFIISLNSINDSTMNDVNANKTIGELILDISFLSISSITTTGLTTTSLGEWPLPMSFMLMMLSCIGGCAGSTTGGMRSIRALLLFKQISQETNRIIHPHGFFNVHIQGIKLSNTITKSIWGFFSLYITTFFLFTFLMTLSGADLLSSWSMVIASLNNLGIGNGDVVSNFSNITSFQKIILCISMILGRLEIFALLVVFTPSFWYK